MKMDETVYQGVVYRSPPSEHRAHYLQNRGEWDSMTGKRDILYYSTCDCGWIGLTRKNHYMTAKDYQKHMGYQPETCGSCGK